MATKKKVKAKKVTVKKSVLIIPTGVAFREATQMDSFLTAEESAKQAYLTAKKNTKDYSNFLKNEIAKAL